MSKNIFSKELVSDVYKAAYSDMKIFVKNENILCKIHLFVKDLVYQMFTIYFY